MALKRVRRKNKSARPKEPAQPQTSSAKKTPRKAVKKAPAAKRDLRKSQQTTLKPPGKRKVAKPQAVLGRPRVPGTADLDQMFRNDYEARQVFEFLKVKTVKELEAHAPDAILRELTAPLVRTVDRIRKALAVNHRYLAGDQNFAVEFVKQIR